MKTFIRLGCVSLLWVIAIASTAKAQTPSTESTPQQPPIFTPRLGVRYTTEGAGFDSFTSLEGFLPLLQNPGNNLTFLQGAVQLDNNSSVATNILLGHRFYNDESNRVTGGYISYSTRDTGESNFDQLGLGFESLGNLDVRFNAYLPLNSSENQLTQSIGNQGSFQGTSLLLPRARLFEVALSGVDAEVGTRLTKLGNGDLRGYAGLYYYSGGDSREAFGWKTRVESRPTDFLGLSLSVQNDQLFDTRVVFSIGANFPGSGATRSKPNPGSALARMAETVERQATILVADETRNDQIAATVAGTGTDNQTLTIIHVAPGGNSDGSFESPFGTIGQAVAIARPGNIIYVRSGDNTAISPFTIPDGVQVLSSGPVQVVNTRELGVVQLPLSGSGRYPTVTGTVSSGNGLITLGNNTVLSGFNIQVAGGNNIRGIQGRNISNVTIQDNRINNATGEGIYLQDVNHSTIVSNTISNSLGAGIQLNNANSLLINNNNISNSGSRGIQIERIAGNSGIVNNIVNNSNSDGISLSQATDNLAISNNNISQNNDNAIAITNTTGTVNLTLAENQLKDNFNGINLNLSDKSQGTVTIDNNSITNPGNAVDVTLAGDANFSNFTISNNEITAPTENIPSQGINFQAFENARVNAANINNNSISNTQGDGITIQLNNDTNTTVNITGNTISGVQNPTGTEFTDGIDLQIFDNATSTVNIARNNIFDIAGRGVSASNFSNNSNNLRITDNNQIRNTTEEGIGIDNFTGTIEIANNTVSNSTIDSIKLTGTANATIQNNTINNSGNQGIRLENATGNTTITNNTVSNSTGEGISLSQTTGTVAISNNTVSNSTVDGIKLTVTANATIQNNTINNSGNRGIRLENATGNTTITNNTVSNSTGEGISLSQTTGTVAINQNNINNNNANAIAVANTTGTVNLTLAENQLKDNFNGINLNLSDNSQGTVTIDNNSITNPGNAVDVTLAGNANFSNFTISNNQITAPTANIPSQGINFQAFENARVNAANINNNTISNTQGDGIILGLNQNSNTTINITGNSISKVQNPTGTEFTDGIDIQRFDNATSTVNIAGNNISEIAGRGISASNFGNANNFNLTINNNNQISNTTSEGIGIDNVGTVTISNNTVSNSAVDGIKLTGTANATIQNNTINNSGNQGIRLENATGNTTITNNTVSNSTGEGISLSQTTGTVAISNNTVSNSTVDGIKLTVTANATIQNNTINNSGNRGIRLENATGNTTITNNTVSNSTGEGISLSQTTGTVAINQNNINNNNANAIAVANTTGTVNLTLADNQIGDNFNGINLNLSDKSQGTVTIDNNSITNPGNAVDVTLAGDANFSNFTISNNEITAPTENIPSQGINFQAFENARVNAANINDNEISNTQGDGIIVGLNQNSNTTINITGNTISNTKDVNLMNFADGVDLQVFDATNSSVTISNNIISAIQGRGISAVRDGNGANVQLEIKDNNITGTNDQPIGVDNIPNAVINQ